jgi:phage FluMu protein Com
MKEPMSGQSTIETLLCPRCRAAQMTEVTSIAPLLHAPGLIAYECPRCGHLTSIVQPPAEPPHG